MKREDIPRRHFEVDCRRGQELGRDGGADRHQVRRRRAGEGGGEEGADRLERRLALGLVVGPVGVSRGDE